MKNFSSWLFLVAIVSLLCLSAPGERNLVSPDNSIALLPDPVPCCYDLPSIQPIYLGDELALSLSQNSELQVPVQFAAESQISFAEMAVPNAFWVKDREICLGELT